MPFLRSTTAPATIALIYITVGTLTMVWTAVYFIYRITQGNDTSPEAYYWIAGFLVTGLVLLLIGLSTGHIHQSTNAPIVVTPQPTENAIVQANVQPVNRQVDKAPVAQPAPVTATPAVELGTNGQAIPKTPSV